MARHGRSFPIQTKRNPARTSNGATAFTNARISQVNVDQLATNTTALSARISQVTVDQLADPNPAGGGRIFVLAGVGGGLAGPARGLAA